MKTLVEASFAHRRKTLPNSVALAGLAPREHAAAALDAIGRPPEIRAEALEPAEFVALARGAVRRAPRTGEDQSRARRRADARRREARGRDRPPARRPRRPGRDRAAPRRSPSRASRRHARPRRARSARCRRRCRAALARDDHEADSGRGRARRRQLRRRDGAPARERDARLPAAARRAARRSPPRSARTCLSSWPTARSSDAATASELEPVDLPQDYWIVLALPLGATKESTAAVYGRFDDRAGARRLEDTRTRRCRARSPPSSGPGTSQRSRRTTSPHLRSRLSSAGWAPSAPTSVEQARPSTGSSITGVMPVPPDRLSGAPPAPG